MISDRLDSPEPFTSRPSEKHTARFSSDNLVAEEAMSEGLGAILGQPSLGKFYFTGPAILKRQIMECWRNLISIIIKQSGLHYYSAGYWTVLVQRPRKREISGDALSNDAFVFRSAPDGKFSKGKISRGKK